MVGVSADLGGEENVPEAVNIELFEIIVGEVKFEAAFEISDALFDFVPVESRD
jgi:hypothetical protein